MPRFVGDSPNTTLVPHITYTWELRIILTPRGSGPTQKAWGKYTADRPGVKAGDVMTDAWNEMARRLSVGRQNTRVLDFRMSAK